MKKASEKYCGSCGKTEKQENLEQKDVMPIVEEALKLTSLGTLELELCLARIQEKIYAHVHG